MPPTSSPTLIINDGSLPALIAALASDAGIDLISWIPPRGSIFPGGRRIDDETHTAVRNQALRLGFGPVIRSESTTTHTSSLLISALDAAASRRCGRVLWPVVVGREPTALVRVLEQAALATQLSAMDSPDLPLIPIETPLAESTPAQLADLAEDLDAPLDGCLLEGAILTAGAV